ncbi:MAG: HAD family phosphatase [Candidatus Cloacimonetes bacterium]|nr:HAD family phosphatase [Candidatus Cloacimonadota bacterium]
MRYKAVIFDLDGTLIDSMGIWYDVDREFLGKRNIEVPDDLFTSIPGGNSYREIAGYFKNRFGLDDSIDEIMAEWTDMVAHHYQGNVCLKEGVLPVLKYLDKNRIKIGLGTSNCLMLTESVLKANKVIEYFPNIIAGCEDITGKPFPDIFLKVAETMQVPPADCIVIEDVLVGVQAARNAGMYCIAIADQYALNEAGRIRNTADYYAENYTEVLRHLLEIAE